MYKLTSDSSKTSLIMAFDYKRFHNLGILPLENFCDIMKDGIDLTLMLNNDYYLMNTVLWADREKRNQYLKITDKTKFLKWVRVQINKAYIVPGVRVFICELNPSLATNEIKCPEKITSEFGVKERTKKEWRQVLTDTITTLTHEDKKILTAIQKTIIRDLPNYPVRKEDIEEFNRHLRQVSRKKTSKFTTKVFTSGRFQHTKEATKTSSNVLTKESSQYNIYTTSEKSRKEDLSKLTSKLSELPSGGEDSDQDSELSQETITSDIVKEAEEYSQQIAQLIPEIEDIQSETPFQSCIQSVDSDKPEAINGVSNQMNIDREKNKLAQLQATIDKMKERIAELEAENVDLVCTVASLTEYKDEHEKAIAVTGTCEKNVFQSAFGDRSVKSTRSYSRRYHLYQLDFC